MDLRSLTKNEIYIMQKQKLEKLVEHAGGVKHLAFMLNIVTPTVNSWIDRGRISKAGAKLVEDHPSLGEYFKAIDLRPDLIIA